VSDQKPSSKKREPGRTNPLEGSPLFNQNLPTLPTLPEAQPEPQPEPQPPAAAPESSPLLYNSPPSPEFIIRAFDKRHDRQTIYIDIRYAGALDALAKLMHRGNKTELMNEMIEDLLKKHADLLQKNEALVRLLEEQYRKKHGL
jgi:hypothetical protein